MLARLAERPAPSWDETAQQHPVRSTGRRPMEVRGTCQSGCGRRAQSRSVCTALAPSCSRRAVPGLQIVDAVGHRSSVGFCVAIAIAGPYPIANVLGQRVPVRTAGELALRDHGGASGSRAFVLRAVGHTSTPKNQTDGHLSPTWPHGATSESVIFTATGFGQRVRSQSTTILPRQRWCCCLLTGRHRPGSSRIPDSARPIPWQPAGRLGAQ